MRVNVPGSGMGAVEKSPKLTLVASYGEGSGDMQVACQGLSGIGTNEQTPRYILQPRESIGSGCEVAHVTSGVTQRQFRRLGRLSPERLAKLDAVGFDWSPWDPTPNRWNEMFERLLEFQREHGHCDVPQRNPQYAELAGWVRNQRGDWKIKRSIMVNERAARRNAIGFSWSLKTINAWELMFEELVAFKKAHGHCKIPQEWPENRVLGKWVNSQRTQFKRGTLRADRRQKLDEIGFAWTVKAGLSSYKT